MKLAPVLLALVMSTGIATSTRQVEKYSLRRKDTAPAEMQYDFSFNLDFVTDPPGALEPRYLKGIVNVTRINDSPKGGHTMRFEMTPLEANFELKTGESGKQVFERRYDKDGKEVKSAFELSTKAEDSDTVSMSVGPSFDPPIRYVGIGEKWINVEDSNDNGKPVQETSVSELIGIELVAGTKCFRIEQVTHSSDSTKVSSTATYWVRVSDGVGFKAKTIEKVKKQVDPTRSALVTFTAETTAIDGQNN